MWQFISINTTYCAIYIHIPFYTAQTTSSSGLFPAPTGQTPVLANVLRRDIHSESDIALCDLEAIALSNSEKTYLMHKNDISVET